MDNIRLPVRKHNEVITSFVKGYRLGLGQEIGTRLLPNIFAYVNIRAKRRVSAVAHVHGS